MVDVSDSVGLVMTTIKLPAFTKGKRQMAVIGLGKSRKLAHLRIHIERVIGLLRQKYSILAETESIDYLLVNDGNGTAAVDKIAIVCSTLLVLFTLFYYAITRRLQQYGRPSL